MASSVSTKIAGSSDTILIGKAGLLLTKEHGLVVTGHQTIGLSIADNLKKR